MGAEQPDRVPCCCRKSTGGETPPVFLQTQKFQNVTLAALPQLLSSEEDVWLLAFTLDSTAATQQEECQSTLRHFANLTQEVGDMVRVGLVTLSDEELGDVHAKAGVPRAELERCACGRTFVQDVRRLACLPRQT